HQRGADPPGLEPRFSAAASYGRPAFVECRDGLSILAGNQREKVDLMPNPDESSDSKDEKEGQPFRLRLPGFITDDQIAPVDVIKRTTSYFGIKPCGGCDKRAAALNRWMTFTR